MSSADIDPSMTHETYCHIRERLESSAPLGRDSVPEVYISRIGSSSATTTSGGVPSCSSQVRTSVQPDGGCVPITTRRVTLPPDVIASSAVGTSAPSTTKVSAPLWSRMKPISSAPSMKFTGTRIAPSLAVAKESTANCQQLWRAARPGRP